MVSSTVGQCRYRKDDGEPCKAPPLRDSEYCFWHDPDHAEAAAEARRLGGLRRRRETVLASAYELSGIRTARDVRRLLEIAVLDTLALDNSVGRSRTLVSLAQLALQLYFVERAQESLGRDDSARG